MGLVSKTNELTRLSFSAEKWLTENIEYFSFKKNDKVLKEGKVCSYLYYVNSGMIGGYYLSGNKEVCNWIASENDFATAYYSFISNQPSHETIECFEDCTLQALSYSKLNEMYELFPESERAGRLILEEYYSRLEERLISIQFKSARERYETLRNIKPEIIKRAPLGRIATYLGMEQETLSRIRAEK
jgi:CRP-like cAMP-binding protein